MENFALNHVLFQWLYIGNAPSQWQILVYTFIAKKLILIFPLFLIYQVIFNKTHRSLAITAFIATIISMTISYYLGQWLPSARPFMDQLGQNYLNHRPDYSFPSDHTIIAATIAFCFLLVKPRWPGIILLTITLLIGYSRIHLAAHYPLDIAGALFIAFIVAFICVNILKVIQKKFRKSY